jgi:predicted branched-subunit amino acid permease
MTLLYLYLASVVLILCVPLALAALGKNRIAPWWVIVRNILAWPLWAGAALIGLLIVEPIKYGMGYGIECAQDACSRFRRGS